MTKYLINLYSVCCEWHSEEPKSLVNFCGLANVQTASCSVVLGWQSLKQN